MSTSIPLAHLPLRPSTLSLLQQKGFLTLKEVDDAKQNGGISNLAQELDISLSDAAALVRELQSASDATTTSSSTALSILEMQVNRSIITFSKAVDNILGGGISLGELTEVAGLPGAGKTQLAMQLCVNASLPNGAGGVCGQAVYIDTEGSFSPERCYSMAEALVKHVRSSSRMATKALPDWFEPETILQGIHVYRVYDEAAQMAVLESLASFLDQHDSSDRPVRLVVLDSIAFHFRSSTKDYLGRTKALSGTASLLSDLATKKNLAVVVVNQMTTKITGNSSQVVPALGESWAHAVTTRLILEQQQPLSPVRTCRLVKSPHKPCSVAFYQVRDSGIRDVTARRGDNVENDEPNKRQRVHD
jgi:RAD51-like protein 2